MRTEKQEMAFAKECQRIEEEGGDVLGYISENYPSYTPRPVWYRLQRKYLNRKAENFTEGRPKEEFKLEESKPEEVKKVKKKRQSIADAAMALIDGAKAGKDAWHLLTEMGYTNPPSAMRNAKTWCADHNPELYEGLKKIIVHDPNKKPRNGAQAAPETGTGENPPGKKKAQDSAPGAGNEREKAMEIMAKVERPEKTDIVTCCAPSQSKGVEVPDVIPEEKPEDALEIMSVRSRVKGYYQKAELEDAGSGYVHLIWRDLITQEERSIGLSVDDWLKLAKEIPAAMKQLGY